jgi:Flp pilus assembly pilin Flp
MKADEGSCEEDQFANESKPQSGNGIRKSFRKRSGNWPPSIKNLGNPPIYQLRPSMQTEVTWTDALRNDTGATIVEYTLLVALIALAGIVSIRGVGAQVNGRMENVQTKMEAAGGDFTCTPANPLYPDC